MKVENRKGLVFALVMLTMAITACSGGAATQTPPPTRAATQTPWIIYVPVTTTPEPTVLPLLPTPVAKAPITPTRTPTRVGVTAKPTVAPTKPPVAPPSAPTASPAPACNIGTVTLTFPENGSYRTKGAAFEMKWIPPAALSGETDPNVGYKIEMESRRGNKVVNGATVYVSHNKYLRDGKFIFGAREVAGLAAGDDAVVTWRVTIVKATGGFDDNQQRALGDVINCGQPSLPSQIELRGFGG
ncbi:MAG: hypothetical protein N2559_03790 [Anaerolineae bacterium]|nr:hypothetical protein [Anaerolineae bacterium]